MSIKKINPDNHKQVLISILKFIYSDSQTRTNLGFKGGTAAMLFYNLPRMSVDLDFDLLSIEKEDQIFEYLKEKLSLFGELKESYRKRYTLFFLLRYKKGFWKIKVEISRRKSISSYEIKNYLGIPMLVMKNEDMIANKLLALVGRNKPAARDFFDVWFFLNNQWSINFDIIFQKTGLEVDVFFNQMISLVEKQSKSFFLNGLGELVNLSQKQWIRENLKRELIFELGLVQKMAE